MHFFTLSSWAAFLTIAVGVPLPQSSTDESKQRAAADQGVKEDSNRFVDGAKLIAIFGAGPAIKVGYDIWRAKRNHHVNVNTAPSRPKPILKPKAGQRSVSGLIIGDSPTPVDPTELDAINTNAMIDKWVPTEDEWGYIENCIRRRRAHYHFKKLDSDEKELERQCKSQALLERALAQGTREKSTNDNEEGPGEPPNNAFQPFQTTRGTAHHSPLNAFEMDWRVPTGMTAGLAAGAVGALKGVGKGTLSGTY